MEIRQSVFFLFVNFFPYNLNCSLELSPLIVSYCFADVLKGSARSLFRVAPKNIFEITRQYSYKPKCEFLSFFHPDTAKRFLRNLYAQLGLI